MTETISYPGRDALRISAAKARERANAVDVARAALAALDAHAHDLAALVARLDQHDDDGPPCAACGLPDHAHMLDPDDAEDWQPHHTYAPPDAAVPPSWPVQPLHPDADGPNVAACGACGRKWDDAAVTSITPAPSARCPFEPFHDDEDDEHQARAAAVLAVEARRIEQNPTETDDTTGAELARMAEADGAVSDGADVGWMIAQALAAARAEGYRQGVEAAQDDEVAR